MEFEILEDMFADMPPVNVDGKDYPVNFHYGSERDLMEFLAINRKMSGAIKYPLVWLQTPIEFGGAYYKYAEAEADAVFHVCTLSNADMSNRERVRTTFANTLEPVTENIINSLRSTPSTGLANEDALSLTKTFKFDTDEENAASDIWDAITLRCRIKIHYNC